MKSRQTDKRDFFPNVNADCQTASEFRGPLIDKIDIGDAAEGKIFLFLEIKSELLHPFEIGRVLIGGKMIISILEYSSLLLLNLGSIRKIKL